MSTYVREQRVEAKQWIASDIERYLTSRALGVVDWVNAYGGEARYEAHVTSNPYDDQDPGEPRIAVRVRDGWRYAAPGDFIEMGTAVFHPHDGSPCSDNPLAGSCSNRVREFIVRNAAYFSEANGWRVTS